MRRALVAAVLASLLLPASAFAHRGHYQSAFVATRLLKITDVISLGGHPARVLGAMCLGIKKDGWRNRGTGIEYIHLSCKITTSEHRVYRVKYHTIDAHARYRLTNVTRVA